MQVLIYIIFKVVNQDLQNYRNRGVGIMVRNKLKEVRLERGISISELARRTNLSRVTINNIEKGYSNPTQKTMLAICRELDKSMNEIFFTQYVNHELQEVK